MLKSRLLRAVGIMAVVSAIVNVLSAQTPASPAFEVASVKQDTAGPSLQTVSTNIPFAGDSYAPTGGLFHATNYPLIQYISFAYKMDTVQMLAFRTLVPDWVKTTNRYDIEARAAGNPTMDQMRLMMQALLADRFKLALHRETRQAPIFALLVNPGKPGTQLRPHSDVTPCEVPMASARWDMVVAGGFPAMCGRYITMPPSVPGQTHVGARNITLQAMADGFPAILFGTAIFDGAGPEVVDRTGLTGMYDFVLEFTPEVPLGANPSSAGPPGPTFREALRDQLGLKLESTTGPVDVFLLDHVEQPTAN